MSKQVKNNWPTPQTLSGEGKTSGSSDFTRGVDVIEGYRDAVNGKRTGSGKLNPSWVEQLMGLPVGWTQLSDAEPGDNRIDRLRLLGNGVVPQTAEKAFRTLLERIK